ncbi:hypothetical protein ACIQPQ_34420 [Streptomyces sp. NPDC091281]|uniref:hypothetical protein n=1 Tax=Streptomyces sp. NPDC091281 TaxID=3365985 RepID=UPI00382A7FAE
MSKQQKAVLVMIAAVVGQVALSKVAKQQATVLGLPAVAVSVAAVAIGAAVG